MKTLLIIITILSTAGLFAQEEYEAHIESIRKVDNRKPSPSSILKDTTFLDYAINEIIKPEEIIYISNRRLLQSFKIGTAAIYIDLYKLEWPEVSQINESKCPFCSQRQ